MPRIRLKFLAPAALLVAAAVAGVIYAQGAAAPPPAPTVTPSTKDNVTPSLELTAPQKRTKPGVAKVIATITAKDAKSIEVAFDVEAQFADEDVEFEWEVREDGRSVQVTIPDSSGIIRVAAWAVVDGKMTSKKLAKTYIEVEYKARAAKAPPKPATRDIPEKPAAEKPAEAKTVPGKVVDAYFVIDENAGDANINALVASVGLRNKLRAAGVRPHVFDVSSPAAGRFSRYVKDAGGTPAMVLVTEAKKVKRAIKCPGTAEGVIAEVMR